MAESVARRFTAEELEQAADHVQGYLSYLRVHGIDETWPAMLRQASATERAMATLRAWAQPGDDHDALSNEPTWQARQDVKAEVAALLTPTGGDQ